MRQVRIYTHSSNDRTLHVVFLNNDRAMSNNNEQWQDTQPDEAINRIILNLRSGGGTGSAGLFRDDRGLFTDTTSRPSTSAGAGMDRLKQEFQDMDMLTQYIGNSNQTPSRPSSQANKQEASIVDNETKKLKKLFLEKTDKLNKMQSHRDALNRAVVWDKLPAKLRIQNKPIVADSDKPKFQQKWNECIRTAERNMVRVLTDHLTDRIQLTHHQIRENTEKTFVTLRTRDNLNVGDTNKTMKEALDQADKDSQARNQLRLKQKQESLANQQKSKKAQKDK